MTALTVAGALKALSTYEGTFLKLFGHGSLAVEIYKPEQTDRQQPHSRDEVYVIAAGSSQFMAGGKSYFVGRGDLLFVPAGVEHRFTNFSEDFATWVIFYGPEGGEKPSPRGDI